MSDEIEAGDAGVYDRDRERKGTVAAVEGGPVYIA